VSHLFIELYLDEDMSVLVADLLRARGFMPSQLKKPGKRDKTMRPNWNMQ
jgi:hypothetical protein